MPNSRIVHQITLAPGEERPLRHLSSGNEAWIIESSAPEAVKIRTFLNGNEKVLDYQDGVAPLLNDLSDNKRTVVLGEPMRDEIPVSAIVKNTSETSSCRVWFRLLDEPVQVAKGHRGTEGGQAVASGQT